MDSKSAPSRLILVGCSKRKQDVQTEAKNLYEGSYWDLKWEFSKQFGDESRIISAKHGVLDPNAIIQSYNQTLRDMSTSEVAAWERKVEKQLQEVPFDDFDEVHVLMGAQYRAPVLPIARASHPVTYNPFSKTDGIGVQKQWLGEAVEAECPYIDGKSHPKVEQAQLLNY